MRVYKLLCAPQLSLSSFLYLSLCVATNYQVPRNLCCDKRDTSVDKLLGNLSWIAFTERDDINAKRAHTRTIAVTIVLCITNVSKHYLKKCTTNTIRSTWIIITRACLLLYYVVSVDSTALIRFCYRLFSRE